jgi:hypothetical protein
LPEPFTPAVLHRREMSVSKATLLFGLCYSNASFLQLICSHMLDITNLLIFISLIGKKKKEERRKIIGPLYRVMGSAS